MKEFNITGLCVPRKHYMVDITNKLRQIEELVQKGKYFTINRGRQYGKTTTFSLLKRALENRYIVLKTSFEGIGDSPFENQTKFNKTFISLLNKELVREKVADDIVEAWNKDVSLCVEVEDLSDKITKLCKATDKEIVVMIDEVDKSSNNQLFLHFIGMLRNKYLEASDGNDATFHSVILAGVYDVKNLKLKLRPEDEKKFNSPWNIAADFEVDMSFNPDEISTMLVAYESDHTTGMNVSEIARELHRYTSGYPFLVSKLCKTIDEKLTKNWSTAGVEEAVKLLLDEKNTLFDDLFKNIENYQNFAELIRTILLEPIEVSFNAYNPAIELGTTFCILSKRNGKVVVSNKIFEILIYDYLISKEETSRRAANSSRFSNKFVVNNKLDLELVLTKFSEFLYSEHRQRDQKFIEREGRLLFLCFLKPIINGIGFYFVEPETRHDRRMDIVITFGTEKFVVELKIWYGESKLEENYAQLADYLDAQKLDIGYLLTFNFNREHQNKTEWIDVSGKKIFSVMV